MSVVALDSSCVITWLRQDVQAWKAIDRLVMASSAEIVLPGPVLTEVIAVMGRAQHNSATPQELATALAAARLGVEPNTAEDLVRAGELLRLSAARPGQGADGTAMLLSLGDALVLAAVERLDCELVTHDRYMAAFAEQMLADSVRVALLRKGRPVSG